MTATIVELIICHTCHVKPKKDEGYTVWEGSNYCDTCWNKYLEVMGDLMLNSEE